MLSLVGGLSYSRSMSGDWHTPDSIRPTELQSYIPPHLAFCLEKGTTKGHFKISVS